MLSAEFYNGALVRWALCRRENKGTAREAMFPELSVSVLCPHGVRNK